MAIKIERINSYNDRRFEQAVLNQHGAYLINGEYLCSFEIVSSVTAVVRYDNNINIDEVIEEFRFHAPHIYLFQDLNGQIIKSYSPPYIFPIAIKDIQPSQFYASEEKLKAVASFINQPTDIIIQVNEYDQGRYISLDGHTRLVYALQQGFEKVLACLVERNQVTLKFVEEARQRGVFTPYDIVLLSKEEYEEKWHHFCDSFIN